MRKESIQAVVGRLVAEHEAKGLGESFFDEDVIELFAERASAVNDAGLRAQVRELLLAHGEGWFAPGEGS